jgi:hypothetical protein
MKAFGLLALLSASALFLAFQAPGDIFLDFGPNDARYVAGFREDFEIDEPTLIHWSKDRARVRLPFALRSPYEVTLRYKRHIDKPAEVRLFLDGEAVETITVPQQDFEVRRFRNPSPRGGVFELGLVSSSEDPRPLGLALDWMSVRPSGGGLSVVPTAPAFLALLSWVAAFYWLPRALGLGSRVSLGFGAAAAVSLVVAALAHKLWPVHAALTLGLRPHAVALLIALFYAWRRRRARSFFGEPLARWAVLLACAGMAVRLFALFHPDFYYPDVRTHSKFVSLIWTEGLSGFLSNHIENQHRHLLGLQYVSGRWVAFPYPPLLYLSIYPLSLLQLPVEDWMKLVPTALLSVEALVLFVIGGKLGLGPRASFFAVLLHASARVLAFRLAVASYAALFGHFWDMLAVLYVALFFDRLQRPLYGAGLGLLVAISILSYAGSVLTLGIFIPSLCLAVLLVSREGRPKLATVGALAGFSLAGALAAAWLFYLPYIPELLGSSGGGGATAGEAGLAALVDPRLTPGAALTMAFHRLRLFYGWPYALTSLALLLAFFWQRGKEIHPLALPLALAASVTYLGMNFLRAGLGATHIFQFSKDDLVILPVIALLLGGLLNLLWEGGRVARALALALVLGWVGWAQVSLSRDVRARFLRPEYPHSPGYGGQSGSEHHPVSAGPFGLVERTVRELEELDLVVRLVRQRAEPEARGQRARELTESSDPELGVDAGAEIVRHAQAVLGVGPVEKDGELVAAEAGDEVGRAKPLLEDLPHFPEDVVARSMPQAVVHVLEPVEVAQQEAERSLVPFRAGDFGLDLALEISVVPKPRKIVEVRHELGLSQLGALHDHGLREKIGLVEEVVEGGGAQIDFSPLERGEPRLMHQESLPVVLHFPRLEVEPKEPKDAVAFPFVIRQTIQFGDG